VKVYPTGRMRRLETIPRPPCSEIPPNSGLREGYNITHLLNAGFAFEKHVFRTRGQCKSGVTSACAVIFSDRDNA